MTATPLIERVPNGGWDERVIVCRYGRLVDVCIVVSQRYVVIVDTVINPQTAAGVLEIAREHLGGGRQLLVVNTHADFDHCWGNQLFAGAAPAYPAPIIAHRRCAEQFRSPEAAPYLAQMQASEPELYAEVILTPPTLLFEDELVIDGGDLTLRLFPTFGHAPDHIALHIPEISTLWAADAAEIPFPFARSLDGLPALRQSLARLAAIPAEVALYCHAPTTIGPALLRHNIAYFDTLEQRCWAALARGAPSKPADDVDVVALVGCTFDDALPAAINSPSIHEFYRTEGHASQLRMMLEWLGSREHHLKQEGA
jgi:glyoxylase-like metal-dependent hydrolase (beta-lactamase superfamily II)